MNEKRTSVERVMAASTGLKRTMKTKAAIMVGVGSTIGTGLFLSSGDVISSAGPGGAIVAYLIGGFIAWLMTSCLGEMSAAMPVSGSLQAYSTEFIGPAMGFTIGWVNWIGAAATITAQIVAAAIIMQDIIPGTPTWLWIVVFSLLLFGVNFFNAKAFGNISFWVSSLKMILVVVFIIIGIAMMLGVTGGGAVGLSNYTRNGGLFPMGIAGIGAVILTSFYAYAGTEMVASTAGEIENEKDMPKAINLTIIILIAATVLSIAIVAALLPWNQASVLGSPFVYVFRNAGLKSAALVVNIIVLTSALTSGNYFVYACSRYLWSMAKFHQAPKICAKTSKSGVPVVALTISMLFAMVGIIAEFVAQDTVYLFLVYFIGGGNIFMYSVICICQYRFRKRYLAEGGRLEDLNFKVASYPLVPILGVLAFAAMLVVTLLDPSEAVAIYVCAPCYLAIYIVSRIYTKKKGVAAANLDI
ncbi:MAG: amino acid permease [Emergencia timonensis]|uniref:amino acid permease n=1 Tax=Emergencia timonensis TaxID=1776384 RepID=UPI00082D50DF|nr:amino acid permease [Emergencia timonensis]WNX88678.1 amino acid permease [Emergencia timonensis]